MEENSFNLVYLLDLIRRYFWYLLVILLVAGIIAIVYTMPSFYKPLFMSSVVIYPTNPERYDVDNLFADEPSIYLYGTAKEVEKITDIANSEEVAIHIIEKFNLWNEYGINKDEDSSPRFYALKNFQDNIQAMKTQGNGVMIIAHHTDPQTAADIANEIAKKTDEINRRLIHSTKANLLNLYETTLQRYGEAQKQYLDSARELRKQYNIYNYSRQTEMMVGKVLEVQSELSGKKALLQKLKSSYGSQSEIKAINQEVAMLTGQLHSITNDVGSALNLAKFREGVDELINVEQIYMNFSVQIENVESKIANVEIMGKTNYATILTLNEAQPSDKKAKPVRWVILLATLILSLGAALLGLIIMDRFLPDIARQLQSRKKD